MVRSMLKLAGWPAARPRPVGLCTLCRNVYNGTMRISSPLLDQQIDTITELRELYRASEARGARLRLLSTSGREMAQATQENSEEVLQRCAERLAFFVGKSRAEISFQAGDTGIAIYAPGDGKRVVGRIIIDGLTAMEQIVDREDAEAFRMHLELMGATIARMNDAHDRDRLLSTLQERELRLEYLVGRMFSAQEEERRRVSQELHDGVAQTATALVRILEGTTTKPNADIPAAERVKLAAIARDLVTELRGVIGGLRPTLLDDLGLEAALVALADSLRADGYDVTVDLSERTVTWPTHLETALFRVAQEAVANIRKHAGPSCRVEVELAVSDELDGSYLRIQDFGKGCPTPVPEIHPDNAGSQVGIEVMRERMAAIGGGLRWTALPTGGVSVVAQFPVIF